MRSAMVADRWTTVLQSLIKWGVILGIARYGYLSVEALAGQTTLADIGIDFLGKVEVTVALAWSFGGAGCIYGWYQRKLRRDTVQRLQKRIQYLESNMDKMRSSSKLTARGDSRPEDVV